MNLVAVIVESRPLPNLQEVIEKHMEMLPENTSLYIFCTPQNSEILTYFPKAAFAIAKGNIDFTREIYNELLTSPYFWHNLLLWDRVLIFQHDSMLLRKGIEEFYGWDYIGASWTWTKEYAGNGGLSLRNPELMLEICQNFTRPLGLNEDHFFVRAMHDYKIGKLAPIEIADKFSCEAKFLLKTLGYHDIDKWLSKKECKQIRNQYNG